MLQAALNGIGQKKEFSMNYATLCKRLDALFAGGHRGEELLDLVRRLAMHRLRDEDAAQEVAIEVWQTLGSYKQRGRPFAAWVNKIIRSRWRGIARERARQMRAVEFADLGLATDIAGAPYQDAPVFPSEKAEHVFAMKADGHDLAEIATAVGMTYGSLRVQCSRWKKQIENAAAC